MQQSDSLCLAVNPPPFDKGGKFSAGRGDYVLLQWLWEWRCSVQREEQARSPTKSERDSAGSGGLVRGEGIVVWQSLQ